MPIHFQLFNFFDYILLAIVALSALYGFKRGFISEILSLATWVIAFVAALSLAPLFEQVLGRVLGDYPMLLSVSSFMLVLLVILVIGVLFNKLLTFVVNFAPQGLFAHIAGAALGFLRGTVLAMLVVFLVGGTVWSARQFFQGSQLKDPIQNMNETIQSMLVE